MMTASTRREAENLDGKVCCLRARAQMWERERNAFARHQTSASVTEKQQTHACATWGERSSSSMRGKRRGQVERTIEVEWMCCARIYVCRSYAKWKMLKISRDKKKKYVLFATLRQRECTYVNKKWSWWNKTRKLHDIARRDNYSRRSIAANCARERIRIVRRERNTHRAITMQRVPRSPMYRLLVSFCYYLDNASILETAELRDTFLFLLRAIYQQQSLSR